MLITGSAGAGVLYLGPAQTCITMVHCGKWLSDATTPTTAITILTAGGFFGFSGGAMYMATDSAEAFHKYVTADASLLKRTGKVALVTFLTVAQNVPLFIISISTTPEIWQTILTVGGNFPGTVFGTVHTIQKDFPYWMSILNVLRSYLHHSIVDACCLMSKEDERKWKLTKYYRDLQAELKKNTVRRWEHFVANIAALR